MQMECAEDAIRMEFLEMFQIRSLNFEPNLKIPTLKFEIGTLKSGFEVWRGKKNKRKKKKKKKRKTKKKEKRQWVAGAEGGGENIEQ